MNVSADFYVANFEKYDWLGSVRWNGLPCRIPHYLLRSANKQEFREAVRIYISTTDEIIFPNLGWPWTWEDSNLTDYAYVFYLGKICASLHGVKWFNIPIRNPYSGNYLPWIQTPLFDFPKMVKTRKD